MPKTRMSAGKRRRNILDAALKVIADSNYYEATTAKIAAQAGITEPIIYLHFASKKELFLQLLDDIRRFIISVFRSIAAEEADPLLKLRKLATAHYEFVIRHGELHKVLSMAVTVNDADVKKKLAHIFRDLRNFFRNQLKEARDKNLLRPDADEEAVALMMLGWIGLVGTARLTNAEKSLTRNDFERFISTVERILKK